LSLDDVDVLHLILLFRDSDAVLVRAQGAPSHGPAALLAACDDVAPVIGELLAAATFYERQFDKQLSLVASRLSEVLAICAEHGHGPTPRRSPTPTRADRPSVDGQPFLIEQAKPGVVQPARIAQACRCILILQACLDGQRQRPFVMLARISVVERLMDGPSPGFAGDALANEELLKLTPPGISVLSRLDADVSQPCAKGPIRLNVPFRASRWQCGSRDRLPNLWLSAALYLQLQPASRPWCLWHTGLSDESAARFRYFGEPGRRGFRQPSNSRSHPQECARIGAAVSDSWARIGSAALPVEM
jgi:hypothetical protein